MAKAASGVSTDGSLGQGNLGVVEIRRNLRGLQAYRDIWASVQIERPSSSGTVPIIASAAMLFFLIKPSLSSGLAALGFALSGTVALILAVWAIDKLLLRAEGPRMSPTVFEISEPDDGTTKRQYAVFDAVVNAADSVGFSSNRHHRYYNHVVGNRLDRDYDQYLWVDNAPHGTLVKSGYPTTFTLRPISSLNRRIVLRDPSIGRSGTDRYWDDVYTSMAVKRGSE